MIQKLKQIFFAASTLQLHVQFDSDVNLVQCDKDLKAHSHWRPSMTKELCTNLSTVPSHLHVLLRCLGCARFSQSPHSYLYYHDRGKKTETKSKLA